MTTKTVDSKGRVSLGEKFKNKTVIIQEIDETEVRVTLARVLPEREVWLHKNAKARKMVVDGLAQARSGERAEAPDLDADDKLAAELEGDA